MIHRNGTGSQPDFPKFSKPALATGIFDLAEFAQLRGWSAEELLSDETKRRERQFRKQERRNSQA